MGTFAWSRQTWITIAFAMGLAFALPGIFSAIDSLGQNIPLLGRYDRIMDYIKGCFTALAFAGFLFILPVTSADRRNLSLIWLAKSFVALFLMLFYEATYSLDAYFYFEQSQAKASNFASVTWGNGTEAIIALLWSLEHYVVPLGSFHAQKVFCAFVSLMGLYLLFRALRLSCRNLPESFLYVLCLFPSVLFWSTTLGKDPINVFGICLSLYGMLRFSESKNPLYVLPAAAGLATVAMVRLWLMPILLLPFVIGATMKFRNIVVRLLIFAAISAGIFLALQRFGNLLTEDNAELLAKSTGQVARSWQRGGSAGDVPIIETPMDMVKFLPYGMFTALFRPLPGEVMNPFGLLAGLENLILLYLLYRSVRNWTWQTWKDPLVIWFFSLIVLWSVLYAFISPQNLGAAVRFRLQILPAMLFLFCYLGFFTKPVRGEE